jgi:SWI/SNF-related matrix-associated actin-dependent regulator of chromatin subfamily A member 5
MKDYQLEGLNWLLKMHACNINGVLADEMGLGKTLQTISLIAQLSIQEPGPPHIIIVPKGTLSNWVKEFKRWCPSLRIFEFYGNLHEREQLRPKVPRTGTYDVLLTTYEIAMAEKSVLKQVKWSYLTIDEAHRIKNERSVLSQVVRIFTPKHRLLITGTPLQNNLHELWSLLNFLMPQVFTNSNDFDSWFNLANTAQADQDYLVKQLHRILRPFMLRRLKREVETKLPPKKELYVFLGMTDLQKDLYRRILTKNIEVINGFGERSQLMNTIMQLRKGCNHPYLFEGIEPGPPYVDGPHLIEACMKFKFLDKLLPRLVTTRNKVLIFTQMTRLLDILDDFLAFRGYKYCRIDGSTHYLDRETQIEKFQNPNGDVDIFILSTRAGGLGINLHAANTVIIYDSDWNPQVDIQAMDRAHRIGQTKVVTVYRFITEGSVEEKIAERAAKKLKMDHLVIQRGALANQNKAPTVQEMNQIVQFGAQQVLRTTGHDIPEEDIDKILEYAEEKTETLNEEMKKLEEAFNLQSFSLDGSSMYEFEGENYKKVQRQHIDLGARNRRSTGFYDVEKYFNSLNHKKMKKKGWRALVGGGHPHQFFPAQDLDELEAKEEKWNEYLTEKTRRRTRGEPPKAKPERFTEKDKQQKKQLLTLGFTNWSKKDFNCFIKACETFGRENYKKIIEEVGTKTAKEIKTYAKAFWENYHTMPNGAELVARIEQGERDIERLSHIDSVLNSKMSRTGDLEQLAITYPRDETQEYTEEEDLFIARSLIELGYGNWDMIRFEAKMSRQFRFNYWFQARSPEELQERSDYLISLFEKEVARRPRKQRKLDGDEESGIGEARIEVTHDYEWIISLPRSP